MKRNRRKIVLTVFSFFAIVSTAFATTMAWIGIFTYANTEKFNINLKTVDFSSEYFLTISSSGNVGSFSESVEIDDLRKQVLKNMGVDVSKLESSEAISYAYTNYTNNLRSVTTTVDSNNRFTPFKRLSPEGYDGVYDNTLDKYIPGFLDAENEYLCFDLYLTVDTKEGISSKSEINSPVFLDALEETLIGTIGQHRMLDNNFRKIDYSTNPYTKYLPSLPLLKDITDVDWIKINAANAVRIGFEIYEPIPIDDEYNDSNKVAANCIYYGGKLLPSLNDGVYDLGGMLPTEFNTAAQELMNMKSYLYVDVPESALNRKELELTYENSQIWKVATDLSSPNNYLGVHNGVQTKMRIRTYMWFEGWDSDCLLGVNNQDVTLNLTFTADHDDKD